MIWTDERRSELKRLIADGMTFRECADALAVKFREPVSRNAVAGTCHRLHIEPLVREKVVQTAKTRPQVQKRRPVARTPYKPPTLPKVKAPPLVPSCVAVDPLDVSLVDNEGCRFITKGTGRDALYCGHPRADKSWCGAHRAIVYQPRGAKDEDADV